MVKLAIRHSPLAISSKQQTAKSKQLQNGFTLIELLVTITIIAILAVIGLAAYGVFKKSARDARRESDLKFLQSALEQYHGDQKYYPASMPASNRPLKDPDDKKIYLNQIPLDPSSNTTTQYKYKPSPPGCTNNEGDLCSGYCIYASLETATAPKKEGNCTLPDGYNLGVTKP